MTAMNVVYPMISARRTLVLEALAVDLRDTTESPQRNVDRIASPAQHDALTAVANRLIFRERVEEALARLRRDAPFAILFLGLDDFTNVNDTLGHGIGNRLLRAAAAGIPGCET